MKTYVARDCLQDSVEMVYDEDRPDFKGNYFAVFHDKRKKKLAGIVTKNDIIHPNRIFADLLPQKKLFSISEDMSADQCAEKLRLLNVQALPVYDKQNQFIGIVTDESLHALVKNGSIKLSRQKTVELFQALRSALHGIEHFHDSFTMVHEMNTGKMMQAMGIALGWRNERCVELLEAGSLHDIGKIALPAQMLEKPAKLNAFEREVVELHPVVGHKIFSKINHPLAALAAEINLYHHEAFDGSGYPNGLRGDSIPIEARICTICDVYDAIRSHRPYHSGIKAHKEVKDLMLSKKKDGLHHYFDPQLLEVFSGIHEEFEQIFQNNLFHDKPQIF